MVFTKINPDTYKGLIMMFTKILSRRLQKSYHDVYKDLIVMFSNIKS